MIVGQVVTATINVTNDGGDFPSLISGTLGGFNLENLTRTNATTYKAQFTVANGGNDYKAGHKIPVDTVVLIDAAGNLSNSFSDSINQPNDPIDANLPNITNVSIPNGTMKVDSIITATVKVTNDGGNTYSLLSGSIGGYNLYNINRENDTIYTAQFIITVSGNQYTGADNIPVQNVKLVDEYGNPSNTYNGSITSQNNDPIYSIRPTGAISGSKEMCFGDITNIKLTLTGLSPWNAILTSDG